MYVHRARPSVEVDFNGTSLAQLAGKPRPFSSNYDT